MPRGYHGPNNKERNAIIIRLWQTGEYTYEEIVQTLSLSSRNIVAGVIHRHKEHIRKLQLKARHGSPQKTYR